MTQEEKQLLLTDLCARLPYGVKCYNADTERIFILSDVADIDSSYPTFDYGYGDLPGIKPYLRPMSSMTEEEEIVFLNKENHEIYDWLNAHHFDYRRLIEKGLAIEAPNGMYKEDKK